MRVLITGGAGFVGRATARAAVEAGHRVRIVSRDAWPSGSLFDRLGVEVVTGDAQDPAVIDTALEGMDVLVQAAATYRYDRKAGPAMANNAALARTILEAAARAKTPKVVDITSLVVFALGHSPVTEGTPLTEPGDRGWTDPYLRSKVESEHVGRELEDAGLPRITIHPGTVIGPEDTAMGTSSGFVTNLLGGGLSVDSRAPWVDVRDVARAIVLAFDRPAGSHYLLTSGVARHRDVAVLLDELTGSRPRRQFLPARHGPDVRPAERPRGRPGEPVAGQQFDRLDPRQCRGRRHEPDAGGSRDGLPPPPRDARRHDPVVGGARPGRSRSRPAGSRPKAV